MSKETVYINKIFQMVDSGMGLVPPISGLAVADRDLVAFELAFFYYFVFDYRIYSQLNQDLRRDILTGFLKKMQSTRPDEFPNSDALVPYQEKRIDSYFAIIKGSGKMGQFIDGAADYINTLLTFSINNNVYACHDYKQAEEELLPKIKNGQYTNELRMILTMSSSPLLIHGVDPTEHILPSKGNWLTRLFKK